MGTEAAQLLVEVLGELLVGRSILPPLLPPPLRGAYTPADSLVVCTSRPRTPQVFTRSSGAQHQRCWSHSETLEWGELRRAYECLPPVIQPDTGFFQPTQTVWSVSDCDMTVCPPVPLQGAPNWAQHCCVSGVRGNRAQQGGEPDEQRRAALRRESGRAGSRVERLVPHAPAGAAAGQLEPRGGWAGAVRVSAAMREVLELRGGSYGSEGQSTAKMAIFRGVSSGRGLPLAHPQLRFVPRAVRPRSPLARPRSAPDPATDSATGCRYVLFCLFFCLGVCPERCLSFAHGEYSLTNHTQPQDVC